MEPVVGFEPTTDGLQNRCSTTELNWRPTAEDTKDQPKPSLFPSGANPTPQAAADARTADDQEWPTE